MTTTNFLKISGSEIVGADNQPVVRLVACAKGTSFESSLTASI
jgi:hypothetical protein